MPHAVDPHIGLVSFRQAFKEGILDLEKCKLSANFYLHFDRPEGEMRLTYALIEEGEVKGTVVFTPAEPIDGMRCFQVGYAVFEEHRNQGVGEKILRQGLAELQNGLKGKSDSYCIEAIISTDNIASQKIANKLLSTTPRSSTDTFTNDPIFQYIKIIEN